MGQLTEKCKRPEMYNTGSFKGLMLTEPGISY